MPILILKNNANVLEEILPTIDITEQILERIDVFDVFVGATYFFLGMLVSLSRLAFDEKRRRDGLRIVASLHIGGICGFIGGYALYHEQAGVHFQIAGLFLAASLAEDVFIGLIDNGNSIVKTYGKQLGDFIYTLITGKKPKPPAKTENKDSSNTKKLGPVEKPSEDTNDTDVFGN